MNRLSDQLDKVERSLNSEEMTRLWIKTIVAGFNSLQEYLTSLLQSPSPEDLLAKRRVDDQRRAGSLGSHRGASNRALAQAERVLIFAQNVVLELNCEVEETVGGCRERLDQAADIVDLAAVFVDEVRDSDHVARSRAPARRVKPPAARPRNRAAGRVTEVIARKLSKACTAITDAMIELEASALTAESTSRKFWNLDLLFGSAAAALASGRRLAVARADDHDQAVTRIRADRHRSWSAMGGPATINRKLVEKSARESSAMLSNKLQAFARASMLASFGDVEQVKTVVSPYVGKDEAQNAGT